MLCEPANIEKPITIEILGKARALTNVAEQYLCDSYAIEQIRAGHFSIENLYMQLDGRYRFLSRTAAFLLAAARYTFMCPVLALFQHACAALRKESGLVSKWRARLSKT